MNHNLINILACPNCQAKLIYDNDSNQLICQHDKLAFPVIDEIPMLTLDQAAPYKSDQQ